MTKDEFITSLAEKDLNGLDSEFTLSTKRLVKSFGAKGAHMNKWWVMTPTTWVCPSCSRSKNQIVRLNKNNFLICHLHEHHDHMKDVVKELFQQYSTQKEYVVADEVSEKFAIKVAFALSAYDNTLICFDCNKADATAKRIAQTHQHFSFSPSEISRFVISSPNKEHRVNDKAVLNVWGSIKETFSLRLQYAKNLAKIAAEKKDWYQPSNKTAKQVDRTAQYLFKINGLLDIDNHEPEKLLYNSEPFKGKNNSWRIKSTTKTTGTPSPNEISHLSATRGKFWNKYDDGWLCPCCNRTKLDCVRPSKKNPWILEIKSVPLYEEDKGTVDYSPSAMCADCCDTAINLGREVIKECQVNIYYPSSVVSIVDLRKVIIPISHTKHAHKNELIDKMMSKFIKHARSIETQEH